MHRPKVLPSLVASLLCLPLTGCITLQSVLTLTTPGDADGNGHVDVWDVRSVARSIDSKHFRVVNSENADVTQSGGIDQGDVEAIDKLVNGQSTVVITTGDSEAEPVCVGGNVIIRATETFLPLQVRSGTVRITSATHDYDSGEQPLTHDKDGRSLYLNWSTKGLAPGNDYLVAVALKKEPLTPITTKQLPSKSKTSADDQSESERPPPAITPMELETVVGRVELDLQPRARDIKLLSQATDVALPFWGLGLHLTRTYIGGAGEDLAAGPLGPGWTHSYNVRLREMTDGSICVLGAGVSGDFFHRREGGEYQATNVSLGKLSRDPDGTFYLRSSNDDLWHFNERLYLDSISDAMGHRIEMRYDVDDQLVEVADESGQTLTLIYDDNYRLATVKDSAGREVQYSYDKDDRLRKVAAGRHTTDFSYDKADRLVQVRQDGTESERFGYDRDGRLNEIFRNGSLYKLAHERTINGSRYCLITDGAGRVLREDIDDAARVTSVAAGERPALSYSHDEHGVREVSSADELRWRVTRNRTDGTLAISAGASERLIKYPTETYQSVIVKDANGIEKKVRRLTSGAITHIQFPDGSVETRYYKQDDDRYYIKRVRANGQSVMYAFDLRGQLIEKRLPDRTSCHYEYDDAGRLKVAENHWGRITFEYDDDGRLTSIAYPGGRKFKYEYAAGASPIAITDPDGNTLQIVRNERQQIASIQDGEASLAAYEYDAAGKVTARRLGNGLQSIFSYDSAGLLHTAKHAAPNADAISWDEYKYDDSYRIVAKESAAGEDRFKYDAASQLVAAKYADAGLEVFDYDPAGNRLSTTVNGVATKYASNILDQYTVVGSGVQQFDLNGNLRYSATQPGAVSYEYDAEGRLTRVRLPNKHSIQYIYNALGQLGSRLDNGKETRFLWDRQQIGIVETPGGKTVSKYIWGERRNELVAARTDTGLLYALQNNQLDITCQTDADGAVLGTYRYRAFGDRLDETLAQVPFGFRGAYTDPDTGLILMGHRWYSPSQGAYLQPAEVAPIAQGHRYIYAANNPVNLTDEIGFGELCCYEPLSFYLPRDPQPGVTLRRAVQENNALSYASFVLGISDLAQAQGLQASDASHPLQSRLYTYPLTTR